MPRNHATIEIARAAEQVFPWLVESERRVQWVDGLAESEQLDAGEAVPGSRFREVLAVAGRRIAVEVTIERLEPGREVAIRTSARDFEGTAVNRVEPNGAGSRVSATLETHMKGFGGRLLGGVIEKHAQRSLEQSLARLKGLLEAA